MAEEEIKCPACSGTGKLKVSVSYTDTLRPVAKKLRIEGYTIREIAAMLGFKHPGSITNLLK